VNTDDTMTKTHVINVVLHCSTSNSLLLLIIIFIMIITDLYSAFRSEDTETLDAAQED